MKRILSILLMLVLLMTAIPVSAQETSTEPLPLGTIVGDGVILYGNPLADSPQVGVLMNGAQVLLVQQNENWVQVYSLTDGQVGWVYPEQIGIMAPDTLNGTVEYYPAIVISKSVSLRVEANVRSDRITSLDNGTLLDILDDQGDWLYVNVWDLEQQLYIQGWVKSDFVVRNPQFVTTHKSTYVYAIPNQGGKKVGELITGTQLVIIGEYGDFWVVNLRSASGFIYKGDVQYIY